MRVGGRFFTRDVRAGEIYFHQDPGLGACLQILEMLMVALDLGWGASDGDYDGFLEVVRFRVVG